MACQGMKRFFLCVDLRESICANRPDSRCKSPGRPIGVVERGVPRLGVPPKMRSWTRVRRNGAFGARAQVFFRLLQHALQSILIRIKTVWIRLRYVSMRACAAFASGSRKVRGRPNALFCRTPRGPEVLSKVWWLYMLYYYFRMFGLSQLSQALNQSCQHGVSNSCWIDWESCPQHTL